jgi:rhomboid-like protein
VVLEIGRGRASARPFGEVVACAPTLIQAYEKIDDLSPELNTVLPIRYCDFREEHRTRSRLICYGKEGKMNSLWPAISRLSCLNTRTVFRTSYAVDSLAARLARGFTRPYSIYSLPFRRRDIRASRRQSQSRIWHCPSTISGFQADVRTFASRRIVTKYEELPRDYTDETGLAFKAEPLSKAEATAIFGKVIDADTANRVLRILHGRRVAGTLGDPSLSDANVYEQQVWEAALAWLRNNVPVDEVQCAGLRAEKELAEMEEQIVSDAERIGLYRPNSRESVDVYGRSGLDAIRKAKERELDEKEAKRENLSQADEVRHNTGTLEKISARSQVELRRPGENPKLKYYLERAKILPDIPPEMSKFQRLWPSALFAVGVVLSSYLFTQSYTPPRPSRRMWPDMPPSAATIIGIFLANSLVLFAWRIPPLFRVLNKFFITVPGYPRPFSLIGNIFSHQSFSHFAVNMTVLWFVGTHLHEEVGRANFLAIYMSSGALGSFASLASWVLRNNFVSASLGASGALCGIVAAYLLLNSTEKVRLFGFFPPENWPSISALGFLVFLISLDILSLNRFNKIVTVDHWAHLGGYAAGIVSAEMLKMRVRQRKAIETERRKNLGFIDSIRGGR